MKLLGFDLSNPGFQKAFLLGHFCFVCVFASPSGKVGQRVWHREFSIAQPLSPLHIVIYKNEGSR